MKYDIVTL